jgi:hypothetical protein
MNTQQQGLGMFIRTKINIDITSKAQDVKRRLKSMPGRSEVAVSCQPHAASCRLGTHMGVSLLGNDEG